MFGGHWSSASGDIKYLTCHMTLQNNHLVERSRNFMSGSSSFYVANLQGLVAVGIVAAEI